MKKITFTIIFLLLITLAQLTKAQSKGQYYEGTINGNLKIQMYLEYKGEEEMGGMTRSVYEGWYYYESQGSHKKIKLKGLYFSAQFILDEEVNGKSTGQFTLFPADESYQGEWTSPKGKTYPVKLKEK